MVGLRRTRRAAVAAPVGRSSVAGVAPETRPDRLRPSEPIATPIRAIGPDGPFVHI